MIWAWIAQRLTGVIPEAIGLALLAAAALGTVTGGLAWLRHDARADERIGWQLQLTAAKVKAATQLRARERQSEAIGAQAAAEWGEKLAATERARAEIEAELATMKANPVCWSRELVRSLNR